MISGCVNVDRGEKEKDWCWLFVAVRCAENYPPYEFRHVKVLPGGYRVYVLSDH